jgi:putative intracellular protease/amidase
MSILLALTMSAALTDIAAKPASAPRVLMVLTSHSQKGNTGQPTGFYLSELTHPVAAFEAAGYQIDYASIQGGEPPVDGVNLDDALNARYWERAEFRAAIRTTIKLDDAQSKRYAAIFYAGGHGTMWDFPDSTAVQRITREIYENNGVVAAVCHGPAALVNVKLSNGAYLVAGKHVSAFTDAEEAAVKLEGIVPFLLASTLQARGARHEAAPNFQAKVVRDGRLVTGQNPASAAGVAESVIAAVREAQK